MGPNCKPPRLRVGVMTVRVHINPADMTINYDGMDENQAARILLLAALDLLGPNSRI